MTDAYLPESPVEVEAVAGRTVDVPERLSWDSGLRRTITIYIPLALVVIILLLPVYWMTTTSFKPDYEMYDYKQYNPFWVHSPTLHNIEVLLFETNYPRWLMT